MTQSKYDPFFSRSIEQFIIAQDFFSNSLPATLRPSVDFSTLVRIDRTNTNAELQKRHRDVAYEAMMQGGRKLLACVEQQSQPDITMPARFLGYSANNLEYHLSEYQKIPLLVNILFYNGKVTPYPYHDTLQAYYDDPAVGSQELALRFHLIDVTQISDQELLTHGHCAPMELLLKHGMDGNFELEIEAYCDVFQACVDVVGEPYISTMLDYAISLSDENVGEKIYCFLKQVLTNKEKAIMNYGQRLQEQGIQQGVRQGIQQGVRQGVQQGVQQGIEAVAKSMLDRGYDLSEVEALRRISQEMASKANLGE